MGDTPRLQKEWVWHPFAVRCAGLSSVGGCKHHSWRKQTKSLHCLAPLCSNPRPEHNCFHSVHSVKKENRVKIFKSQTFHHCLPCNYGVVISSLCTASSPYCCTPRCAHAKAPRVRGAPCQKITKNRHFAQKQANNHDPCCMGSCPFLMGVQLNTLKLLSLSKSLSKDNVIFLIIFPDKLKHMNQF